jgi:hypothetical protein
VVRDFYFMLPEAAIIQFKKIWKKLYGIELSDNEASFRANNLVALYRAVYGNRQDIQNNKQINSNHAGENNIQTENK